MKWVEESLWWFRSAAVEVLVPQPPLSTQRTKVEGREVVLGVEAALVAGRVVVVDSRMAVVEHNPGSLGKPAADTRVADTLVADKPGCCSRPPKLPGLGPSRGSPRVEGLVDRRVGTRQLTRPRPTMSLFTPFTNPTF